MHNKNTQNIRVAVPDEIPSETARLYIADMIGEMVGLAELSGLQDVSNLLNMTLIIMEAYRTS